MTKSTALSLSDDGSFIPRHIGPNQHETAAMLEAVGHDTLDALIDATVPEQIRLRKPLAIAEGKGEAETLAYMRTLAAKNQIFKSYIGMGYYDTFVPPSSSATSSRIRAGTRPTRRIRPRSRRGASRHSSTSRRSSST